MWCGHFDLWSEEALPMFRHVLLLRGGRPTSGQVEDLIEIAITECERFRSDVVRPFRPVVGRGAADVPPRATVARRQADQRPGGRLDRDRHHRMRALPI